MAVYDRGSKETIMMHHDHYMVHAGKRFAVSMYFATVGNSASAEFVCNLTASSSPVHARMSFGTSAGPVRAYLYESHTNTALGTALQTRNLNRDGGADTATVFWTHTPNAATTGAATVTIGVSYVGAASHHNTRIGAGLEWDDEVILAPAQKYLLRVENISGGNADIVINAEWYELD